MGLTEKVTKIRERLLKLLSIQSKIIKADKLIEQQMSNLIALRNDESPVYDGSDLDVAILKMSNARHALKQERDKLQVRIDALRTKL